MISVASVVGRNVSASSVLTVNVGPVTDELMSSVTMSDILNYCLFSSKSRSSPKI
jgi:hypothetical protein